ncbi:flagellar cap protein [Lysinibacillus contaminans]|uniref:Flagellar cap protein n=1 Tax=Lysinibacillus contaminans TaxID=1293441 RepID=A0ABR5K2T9_9BACI|nr:hypothetical protein [Lysinibacillus contaminans]KOS69161.1 flagellar cap protein [Lysinibacillus contaminans]
MSIAIVAIIGGVVIALAGIFTEARTRGQKIKMKTVQQEIELEKLRLESYTMETEKMRLELEHSKVQLLETKQSSLNKP